MLLIPNGSGEMPQGWRSAVDGLLGRGFELNPKKPEQALIRFHEFGLYLVPTIFRRIEHEAYGSCSPTFFPDPSLCNRQLSSGQSGDYRISNSVGRYWREFGVVSKKGVSAAGRVRTCDQRVSARLTASAPFRRCKGPLL
jgi:hypothetical protein